MRKTLASLLLVAVAVPLGGCNAIFGGSKSFAAQKQFKKQVRSADFAQSRLAEGRQALDKGNWAEAVMAFRDAQRDPQFAAQAHNGIGVAYAQLGRADIAERYFLLALSEAPEDRRFAANLSRLYALNAKPQPVMAAAPEPVPALAAPRSALTTTNPSIRVERPSARLVRTAQGELRLQAAPDGAQKAQMASAEGSSAAASSGVTFTRRSARPQ